MSSKDPIDGGCGGCGGWINMRSYQIQRKLNALSHYRNKLATQTSLWMRLGVDDYDLYPSQIERDRLFFKPVNNSDWCLNQT
jgi:hypothetical protein